MSLTHNSTLSNNESELEKNTDKAKLPHNAYANMESKKFAHHCIADGETGGKQGLYVKGNMYLSRSGLKSALQELGNSSDDIDITWRLEKLHLISHANAIGMDKKETAALLNMPASSLADFLNNNTNANNTGGENTMGMTYEELEAKVRTLEASITEKEAAITGMKTSAETLASTVKANVESMEGEIAKYEKSEGELNDKVDGLEKEAKTNKVFIEAGKTAIDDMKAEINKMSAQVDGNDYNKELVDKQLNAFGTDVAALTQFKSSLESRRTKMFKSGEIHLDKKEDEKTKTQSEYALGQSIGRGNVIPIK